MGITVSGTSRIAYQTIDLMAGDHDGTAASAAGVRLVSAKGVRGYADPFAESPVSRRYDEAVWTPPEIGSGFTFSELIATWHADTPGGSWVEVSARVHSDGEWSRWLALARWADHDTEIRPASVPNEGDEVARVATDTLVATRGADAWQLRVALLRPVGSDTGPVLSYAGAMVSATAAGAEPSRPGSAVGRDLDVPPLSQRVHAGHYPHWNGGGSAWCSPTCAAMVLAYWGTGPGRDALSWVDPTYPDPAVYDAVRHTFDHAYGGTGNWSFNAAYAARFGLCPFVTRLRDLTEAERFITAGIPLIASLKVDPARLRGADYDSDGHLVVVAGFTAEGDVVVNDPAAREPSTVRRTYRRAEFEAAWRGGSGGLVYVIHPGSVPLPRRPAEPNW